MDSSMETVLIWGIINLISSIGLRYAFPSIDGFLLIPVVFFVGIILSLIGAIVFGEITLTVRIVFVRNAQDGHGF